MFGRLAESAQNAVKCSRIAATKAADGIGSVPPVQNHHEVNLRMAAAMVERPAREEPGTAEIVIQDGVAVKPSGRRAALVHELLLLGRDPRWG